MAVAAALGHRGRARTWPNPNVGSVVVRDGIVVGRGWTQAGGRPHAEALALAQAGEAARDATLYTTLEPCAHASERGPTCSVLIAEAGVARVVYGARDPDPRTDGRGVEALGAAGIAVSAETGAAAARSLEGYLTRHRHSRPHVTLKLAVSLDGCIARADGESLWITGEAARAHGHVERSRCGVIVVGRGTWEADTPRLDVRLAGLEGRSPAIAVLSGSHRGHREHREGAFNPSVSSVPSVSTIDSPSAIATLSTDHVLIEGGASAAAAFLEADLVDRLLLYTAPILIGSGKPALGDIGLAALAAAHGRWTQTDSRSFGPDRLDIYDRVRD
ncbi:MAG: bifunctional diaminohydroxyphosphoribosylaminopyrimidine deaminase/5-amino-6-(5-phosphoribosylamino)uracil reductase RibD [Sphingomonadaceae bacterium]